MMDCNSILRKYSRYVLVIFNFVFVLTGIVLISVGATVKGHYNEYATFLETKYIYASDLLIAIGVIIFVIAFFGCCGALRENACMTLTFSSLLIVILILEVIAGIGGVLLKSRTETVIDNALTSTLTRYGLPNETEVTKLWDDVQKNFNCCGVHNYTDWSKATNTTKGLIPIACCTIPPGTIGNFSCIANSTAIHPEGCLDVFSDYIEGHATSIGSVGLALAIIQLLGIVLSCYLSKQIRSDYETV